MKRLIKFILILALCCFALVDYRVFSFNKGLSSFGGNGKSDEEILYSLLNVEKVEYYEIKLSRLTNGENGVLYMVYLITSEDAYLVGASQKDIDAMKVAGFFANPLKPEKISPIPLYVEGILALVILFFPIGRKKKVKEETKI